MNPFFNHFPARGWKRELTLLLRQMYPIFFNHFPARGWKPLISQQFSLRLPTFSIISPQGDGNRGYRPLIAGKLRAFSIISPQGDGNSRFPPFWRVSQNFFFNHFPARGWKPLARSSRPYKSCLLFQSFPRKGMETSRQLFRRIQRSFFNHFPARGWKRVGSTRTSSAPLYSSFSIISPQGDGNLTWSSSSKKGAKDSLFQSFPRKGMETE